DFSIFPRYRPPRKNWPRADSPESHGYRWPLNFLTEPHRSIVVLQIMSGNKLIFPASNTTERSQSILWQGRDYNYFPTPFRSGPAIRSFGKIHRKEVLPKSPNRSSLPISDIRSNLFG